MNLGPPSTPFLIVPRLDSLKWNYEGKCQGPDSCFGSSQGGGAAVADCVFPALGRVNVKNEEIDEMLKEAPGPINFTVFLQMFGEKLKGKFMCRSIRVYLCMCVCICARVCVCVCIFTCLHLWA